MLRASIEFHGREGDLRALTDGSRLGDAGIPHGERLNAFAEAAVAGDAAQLATARAALRSAAGSAALVDAAAVVGNFQRMVRIADGTGIPVDAAVRALSGDFRESLGLEGFATRRGAGLGPLARAAAPLLRGLVWLALRFAGRRSRRRAAGSASS
jgi:hypothetical protein